MLSREELGMIVYKANRQALGDVKMIWTFIPWEQLPPDLQEIHRRIGEAVVRAVREEDGRAPGRAAEGD